MKNKTILEKIGISDAIVKKWKKKGLKITYPVRENVYYFKSADGKEFVENADKFIPHLTNKETKLYIRQPKRFNEDLLKNLKFFIKFCNFIYKDQKDVEKLEKKEKVAALLSLLYLFQRAMDYHYFHWDRYLVYEDYPQTPVGYWLKKLKDLYIKAGKKEILKLSSEDFLKLMALDKKTFKKIKSNLSKNDFLRLKKALKSIKIFEKVQQEEVKIVIDLKNKENILIRTGFPMLNKIEEEIKKHPEFIKKRNLSKIKKIMKLHPIIVSRKFLLSPILNCFDKEIFSQFKKEIKRWLK